MSDPHPYVVLARETVRRLLSGEGKPSSGLETAPGADMWNISRACFVSIKKSNGDLRGCIGTIAPVHPRLDAEIMANAVSSATRDPRFDPIEARELDGLVFSVDVLSEPEPVRDISELDPKKWGVIVSSGYKRGVLLPDLEGVDTVESQLDIAARKAGIRSPDGAAIERFTVDRYSEK
jgi:AmmeMemoRadiSam system protein A